MENLTKKTNVWVVTCVALMFSVTSFAVIVGNPEFFSGRWHIHVQESPRLDPLRFLHDNHKWTTGSRARFITNNTKSSTNLLVCRCSTVYYTFVQLRVSRSFLGVAISDIVQTETPVICPRLDGGYVV